MTKHTPCIDVLAGGLVTFYASLDILQLGNTPVCGWIFDSVDNVYIVPRKHSEPYSLELP